MWIWRNSFHFDNYYFLLLHNLENECSYFQDSSSYMKQLEKQRKTDGNFLEKTKIHASAKKYAQDAQANINKSNQILRKASTFKPEKIHGPVNLIRFIEKADI